LADLNCLRNSAAVAGLGRAATVEWTPLGLLGEGLGPGKFFCLPGFAGGRLVCDAEGGKKTLNAE
jgi:hypothetical protein